MSNANKLAVVVDGECLTYLSNANKLADVVDGECLNYFRAMPINWPMSLMVSVSA